jgi:hypothetical protein
MPDSTDGKIPRVTLAAPILVMPSTKMLEKVVRAFAKVGIEPVLTLHTDKIHRFFYVNEDGVVLFILNDDNTSSELGEPRFGISLITGEHAAAAEWLATELSDNESEAWVVSGSVVDLADADATFVVPDGDFVFPIRVRDEDMGGPAPVPFERPEDWTAWHLAA